MAIWLAMGSLLFALVVVAVAAAPERRETQEKDGWVVPERRAERPNPIPAGADAVTRGREVYRQECRPCHGGTGRGDGPKAAELDSKVPVALRKRRPGRHAADP